MLRLSLNIFKQLNHHFQSLSVSPLTLCVCAFLFSFTVSANHLWANKLHHIWWFLQLGALPLSRSFTVCVCVCSLKGKSVWCSETSVESVIIWLKRRTLYSTSKWTFELSIWSQNCRISGYLTCTLNHWFYWYSSNNLVTVCSVFIDNFNNNLFFVF